MACFDQREGHEMKRATVYFLFLVLGSAYSFAGEPGGAGELSWGDPLPEHFESIPVDDFLRDAAYENPQDTLRYDDIHLEQAEYEFRNGEFARAVLYFKGEKNFKALKKVLKEQYGTRGKKVESILAKQTLQWTGKETFANLNLISETEESLLFLCPTKDASDMELYRNWEMERKIGNRLCKCPELVRMAEATVADLEMNEAEVGLVMEIGYGGTESDVGSCIEVSQNQAKGELNSRRNELQINLENARIQKEILEMECQRVSMQMQQLRAFVAKKRTEVLEAMKQ
jgi:hypothetical protein